MGLFDVYKFDPGSIGEDKIVAVIGKRGSGKSLLVKDIMYHKRKIPAGIVMSGTEDGNRFYSDFVPDSFVFSEFNKGALEKLVDRQRRLWAQGRKTRVFVILDDLVYDKSIMKEKVIRQLFFNGRHWGIFLIVTAQFITDLPPGVRANCDVVVACREAIYQNRKKLYEMVFGVFPTFKQFDKVFQSCTENYEVLVIDNTKQTNKIQDCVFWYKAQVFPSGSFRAGHPVFWKFHRKNYVPDMEDEEQRVDGLRKI